VLVGLLADTGRKRRSNVLLGSEQERALRQAATAAVKSTVEELSPDNAERAEQLAVVLVDEPARPARPAVS
jgi:hypothetical protein